jgi:hypothetical protein
MKNAKIPPLYLQAGGSSPSLGSILICALAIGGPDRLSIKERELSLLADLERKPPIELHVPAAVVGARAKTEISAPLFDKGADFLIARPL